MIGSHKVKLSDIIVPEKRFRAVDEKVKDIVESLKKFGQLQPVILRPLEGGKFLLVDGLHRLTAARTAGWDEIEAVFTTEIDPTTLRKIELEVNIQRIDMSWQERVNALAELHGIETEANPNASQADIANIAGVHQPEVSKALKISKMLALFPELAEAKSLHQALSWAEAKAKRVLRTHDVRTSPAQYRDLEEKILLGDSTQVIKTIPDGQFDLVLTDPPFGINFDSRKIGTAGSLTSYTDDVESYERILAMAPDIYRVIKQDGWLVWFLGFSWYERAKQAFREAGFLVDEIPIVWNRSDGKCFTNRPDRYFARGYDIALHCIKGNPQVMQRGKPNVITVTPVGNSERELLVERPVELYEEIIRRLTLKGEVVADFFVGSGSVLAAAASLGREFFGCELDPERRAYALQKVKAHIPDSAKVSAG